MTAQYRLGIDAGGTFTDFVIADRKSGTIKLFKALSTPANPTTVIENGLQLIAEHLGRRGTGKDPGEIDDPDTLKDACHVAPHSCLAVGTWRPHVSRRPRGRARRRR